ncbi:MAG: hypothetical protein HRU05_15275 [Oceanospirillaceae bacterium]|nr:hypothetical protein [Oceanospirillaceae bacterium]
MGPDRKYLDNAMQIRDFIGVTACIEAAKDSRLARLLGLTEHFITVMLQAELGVDDAFKLDWALHNFFRGSLNRASLNDLHRQNNDRRKIKRVNSCFAAEYNISAMQEILQIINAFAASDAE